MNNKSIITNRFGLWAAIVISFCLAVADMFFLRDGFQPYIDDGTNTVAASILAFLLATIANVSAFLWGYTKGHFRENKKQSKSFKTAWIALGVIYAIIRASIIVSDSPDSIDDILGQAIIALFLTISYIGSGTTIQWAASQLFDADIANFRNAQKEFKKSSALINRNNAALWKMIDDLKKFKKNYEILDKQYDKEYDKIVKNERSVMAQIVGKTIAKNPAINPVNANEVMEEVLKEREVINKKNHATHQQVSHR